MDKNKSFPSALVATLCLGWFFINVPMFILGPILPAIETEFNISHAVAGILVSSYMMGYAIMQLFAGALGERFGEKNILIIGILGTSVMGILTWVMHDYNQMIVLRFMTGLFGGMYYAPSNALVANAADHKDRGKALGLVFTSGPGSNMLVYFLTGLLVMKGVNWSTLFLLYCLPGLVCTPLMFLLLRRHATPQKSEELETEVETRTFSQTLKSLNVIKILAFNSIISLAGWTMSTFLPTFFVRERGLAIPEASFLMNIVSGMGIFCMPLAGYITDTFGFKVPSYISMAVLSTVTFIIPAFSVGPITVFTFILWGLFGGMAGTAMMVLLTNVVPARVRATFFGILNFVGWIGGSIGPVALGKVIDLFGFTVYFRSIFAIYVVATIIIFTAKK